MFSFDQHTNVQENIVSVINELVAPALQKG